MVERNQYCYISQRTWKDLFQVQLEQLFNKSCWNINETFKHYGYKPYKFKPVQNLTEYNKRQGVQFCREMFLRLQDDADFFKNILFTDESTYTLAGMYSRKNKHIFGLVKIIIRKKMSKPKAANRYMFGAES